MSRSGYSDDIEQWSLIRWRGQVASAIRGSRGQRFLVELLSALDAMPRKKLIADHGKTHEGVCALGSLGELKNFDMEAVDRMMRNADYDGLGELFGIAPQLAQEVMYENDERWHQTPEGRWQAMRDWALAHLRAIPTAQEGQ